MTSILKTALEDIKKLDESLDPEDWAGDESMLSITGRVIAALKEAIKNQGEPVAYIHKWKPHAAIIGKSLHFTDTSPHGDDVEIIPLYHLEQYTTTLERLAESQAREKVLRDALVRASGYEAYMEDKVITNALALPSDSTALDSAISQAMREALLEAINEWEKPYGLTDGSPFIERLRRMAEKLK